jgi:FkbH-like protein
MTLRQEIDQLIAADAVLQAARCLARLWREDTGPAAAAFIVSRYEQLRQRLSLTSSRLFILRSFTIEPAVPLLRASAFVSGTDLNVGVGNFNTYAQEILDPTSRLYRFDPELVIFAVQTRDVAPDLWDRYTDCTSADRNAVVERVVTNFHSWIRTFRSHSQAHLIVHTLEVPPLTNQGILDSQLADGQVAAIQQINQALRRIAAEQRGVYMLDYDALIARYGRLRWHDERKWLTMRMPVAADNLVHLTDEWSRYIQPLTGKICKVLVADLDNTLWGGVIGEDGMEGIKVGEEYPGATYRALQRVMLDLYHRGILLAICSKNNPSDAMAVLESHPGMLLRPQHFAALRINWNDKVQSLREIAAELNVGIDTLAFMDDNPVERERVRTELPEVTVIDLAADNPMEYARTLRATPVFERLILSAEDRERGRYYVEQRQRVELERSASSLEDFYYSLQQEVEIVPVTPATCPRIAQLTQKTNQFNITTRRYSEQQVGELIASPGWSVCGVRVKDRFGDNGLVGVVVTRDRDAICEIDTFLLSCRVIGRTVETAVLSWVAEHARTRGMRRLEGWFFPTKKNAPAKEFYSTHGFRIVTEQNSGTLWVFDLKEGMIAYPQWITLSQM